MKEYEKLAVDCGKGEKSSVTLEIGFKEGFLKAREMAEQVLIKQPTPRVEDIHAIRKMGEQEFVQEYVKWSKQYTQHLEGHENLTLKSPTLKDLLEVAFIAGFLKAKEEAMKFKIRWEQGGDFGYNMDPDKIETLGENLVDPN